MKKFLLVSLLSFCFYNMQAQDTTLKEYIGKYIFAAGSYVPSAEIMLKDSVLSATSVQGSSDLVKKAKDTFTLAAYDGIATFTRNGAGKVAGVNVKVGDVLLEGTKEQSTAWIDRKPHIGLQKTTEK